MKEKQISKKLPSKTFRELTLAGDKPQNYLDTKLLSGESIDCSTEMEKTHYYDVPYYGSDVEIRNAIVFVLQHIPKVVRIFAQQRCVFTSLDKKKMAGSCLKLPQHYLAAPELWVIELSEEIYYKSSWRYQKYRHNIFRYYVAHELAHAFLNHHGNDQADYDRADQADRDVEFEADEMAQQWGFKPATGNRFYTFYAREKEAWKIKRRNDEKLNPIF